MFTDDIEKINSKDLTDIFFRAVNKLRQNLELTDIEKDVLRYVNINDIDVRG